MRIFSWSARVFAADKAPFIFLYFVYLLNSYSSLGTTIVQVFILKEDYLQESMSAIFLLFSSLLLLLSARKVRLSPKLKHYSSSLLVLAIAIFLWFAEEISWGQRIFDFNIKFIEEFNSQSETTIHNLDFIQQHLHYSYFFVFLVIALMCISRRNKASEAFSLLPSSNLFFYFFLPASYYLIGQMMRDFPVQISSFVFEYGYTLHLAEAYEFLLAAGVLKYSIEKYKVVAQLKYS